MHRIEEIRNMGYTVDIEWECDVTKELRANPEMRKFFEDYNTKGSIGKVASYCIPKKQNII